MKGLKVYGKEVGGRCMKESDANFCYSEKEDENLEGLYVRDSE